MLFMELTIFRYFFMFGLSFLSFLKNIIFGLDWSEINEKKRYLENANLQTLEALVELFYARCSEKKALNTFVLQGPRDRQLSKGTTQSLRQSTNIPQFVRIFPRRWFFLSRLFLPFATLNQKYGTEYSWIFQKYYYNDRVPIYWTNTMKRTSLYKDWVSSSVQLNEEYLFWKYKAITNRRSTIPK